MCRRILLLFREKRNYEFCTVLVGKEFYGCIGGALSGDDVF